MDWLNWGLIAPNIEASCRLTEKTFWELTRNGWFTMIIWFNMTSYQDSLIHLNTNNHLPFVGPFSAMIHTVLGQEVLLWDCCTQTSGCSKLGTLAPRKRMTKREWPPEQAETRDPQKFWVFSPFPNHIPPDVSREKTVIAPETPVAPAISSASIVSILAWTGISSYVSLKRRGSPVKYSQELHPITVFFFHKAH